MRTTIIVCEKCYETTLVDTTKYIEVKNGSLTIVPELNDLKTRFTYSGGCPKMHGNFHLFNPEELRNLTNGEGFHGYIKHAIRKCKCQFHGCRERTPYYCVDEGCTQHQHRFSGDRNHLLDSTGTFICRAHQGHCYQQIRLRGGEINEEVIKY